MPLTSIPPLGAAHPKLLGQFEYLTPITFSVTGPNTVYVAETATQLLSTSDAGTIDALSIVAANCPFVFWAIGDVYIAGSQAAGVTFLAFIYIPGPITTSGLLTEGAYGIGPSSLEGPQTRIEPAFAFQNPARRQKQ